jgi:NADPH:quinone reductase-like Zn-dependent oxidoreductase
VLVLAGGSGVGSAAIQIAKLFGCTVIATAGDERKLERSRELGADFVINHYRQKIGDEVKRITNKAMCDVVFEHVGTATWQESMKSLKPGGSLVTCGATTGPEASFDIRFLFARQLSFLGSYMGTMGDLHQVLKQIFAGRLKPVLDRTFPLANAADAHRYLEDKEQFGKVVLLV